MKKCNVCGQTKELSEFYRNKHSADGISCWCRECNRAKCKRRYDSKAESERKRKREATDGPKFRARILLKSAIKAGKIIRQPCEVCGKPDGEAHHPDYSKPLEVRWLCRDHHCEEHNRIRDLTGYKFKMDLKLRSYLTKNMPRDERGRMIKRVIT